MALTARPIPSRVMQDLDRIAKGDLSALERFSRTPLHLCDWRVRISCAEKGHREVAIDVFRRSWLTHSGPQQDVSAFADDPKKALAASSAAKSSARVFVEPRLIVERLGFGDPWELVDKNIAPAGFSFVEHGSPHFRQRIKKSLDALVGNEGPSPDLAQFEFLDPGAKTTRGSYCRSGRSLVPNIADAEGSGSPRGISLCPRERRRCGAPLWSACHRDRDALWGCLRVQGYPHLITSNRRHNVFILYSNWLAISSTFDLHRLHFAYTRRPRFRPAAARYRT